MIINTLATDFIGKAIDLYDSIGIEPNLSITTKYRMKEIKTYCSKEAKKFRNQVLQNRIDLGFPKSIASEKVEFSSQKSLPDGKGDFWIVVLDDGKAVRIERFYDPAY